MPAPQISPLPNPPSRSQSPATFSVDADAFLGALPDFQEQANDQADYLDALAIAVDADAAAADADAASALSSKNDALASQTAAAASAAAALVSQNAAAASFDSFDDRYLGAKSSNPSVDNDGNALLTGALYWNTTSSQMRVYTGSAWEAAYLPSSAYVQGPASSTENNIALFDGTTGKVIKDGGSLSAYIQGPASSTANNVALFDGTTGKLLKDGPSLSTYAPLASPTFTGTATTATLDALGSVRSNVTTVSASAIDCSVGNYFIKTASGGLTWTVTNVPTSRAYSFILELTNGGTGTQTWMSGIKWPNGTAPTLVASGVDVLGFITDDGGTTWRGVQLMKDSK
jgi:hypothetical protein